MGSADIVIGCSGARDIAKKIALKSKKQFSQLIVEVFPDNELRIRFPKSVKNKKVYLIQSFYGDVNKRIIETLIAFYTAKDLGASQRKGKNPKARLFVLCQRMFFRNAPFFAKLI